MTISRESGVFVVNCDVCSDTYAGVDDDGFETFHEAVEAARSAGWRSRRSAEGKWENVCTSCT
jgi:hypothetical protein